MNDVHISIMKGNAGEIGALAKSTETSALGVDSVGSFKDPGSLVKTLARSESEPLHSILPHSWTSD